MDFTEINLRKIEKHFADGCKNPDDGFFIGVEIEHFVIGQDDGIIIFRHALLIFFLSGFTEF